MRRSAPAPRTASSANRSSRLPAFASRPSADLAGRAVALSGEIPTAFDTPMAPHHKLIGRWLAARRAPTEQFTRPEVRRYIERTFGDAVLEILEPFKLADLRVTTLIGEDGLPPAIAVTCDTVGQIELGWIEKSNVLRNTLFGNVSPARWQAAAYKTLVETLPAVLPIFDFDYLFDELSAYYWDGQLDDESARRSLIEWQGFDESDIDEDTLPSAVKARRPAWMLAENAAPLKDLPRGLADRIRKLRAARDAVRKLGEDGNAWCVLSDPIHAYVPGLEDSSTLPPMTLVPFEEFARELDDIGRFGMETGFTDCAGLCPLPSFERIDEWFASFRVGMDLLLAAQALIEIDPAQERSR
jgi:hypothetical protein